MNFILGFIIGAVAEFIAFLVIAHEIQKKRDIEVLMNGNGNSVKYEYKTCKRNDGDRGKAKW